MSDRDGPRADGAEALRVIEQAARETRIDTYVLIEYIERELVSHPLTGWDQAEREEARRVRRLTELGINLQGIEVILRMRRRLADARQEARRLEREMRRLRREHDREIARLLRELARDI